MNFVETINGLWPDVELPRYVFPPKEEVRVELPEWVRQSPVMPWVRQEIGGDLVYRHQALALEAYRRGENVALDSPTDSGKSLIAQIAFLHGLMTDPHATYMGVLPLTALNRDQMTRWDIAADILGLPKKWFVKIDRSMPVDFRLPAMKDARLVFITPHSLHGWYGDNYGDPGVDKILKNLRGGFLDEVQAYEDVLGTNAALLFRRIITLHTMLDPKRDIQWIAASGTLGLPKTYLKRLLSRDFTVVGRKEDGSRKNRRTVFHVQTKGIMARQNEGIRIASTAIEQELPGQVLYFIDSRNRVEEVAEILQRRYGEKAIMAYSGRYTRATSGSDSLLDDFNDRIKDPELKAIITTSALQSGVNLRNANVLINDGIPLSINDFLQRLGRTGRGLQEESFAFLVGDSERFARFVTDGKDGFTSYMETPPEIPSLNLDNRALIFIHAQCLLRERRNLGLQKTKIPAAVVWPKGTNELLKLASADRSQLPPELQPLKVSRLGSPNIEFPLLNTGMRVARVMLQQEDRKDTRITDMSVDRALIECPPGGTFRFGIKYYFVTSWRYSRSGWQIGVQPSQSGASTRGIVAQEVNANLHSGSVVQSNFLSHPKGPEHGFLAEMNMQVLMKLTGITGHILTDEGYRTFKVQYRDVEREAAEDAAAAKGGAEAEAAPPSNVRQSKFFAQQIFQQTTGIVLHLPETWFGRKDRDLVARTLVTSYMRAKGTEVPDPSRLQSIGFETDHVNLQQEVGGVLKGGTIAIFDRVQFGLRLTESIFAAFRAHLEDAINESREALGEEGVGALERLLEWHATLVPHPLPSPREFAHGDRFAATPPGHTLMFAVGSIVDRERDGVRTALRVVGYGHMENPDTHQKFLSYRLQAPFLPGALRHAPASFDHAGRLMASRNELSDAPTDGVATVPKDQVQAPLTHVRFAFSWVNDATLEVTPPVAADPAQAVSGNVPTNDVS